MNFTPLDNKFFKNNKPNISYGPPEKEPGMNFKSEKYDEKAISEVESKDSNLKEDEILVIKTEEKSNIELHPELKKAGLQIIDSSSLDPKHLVSLPISDLKILSGLKSPPTSSLRWVAEKAVLTLSKAHLALKMIHGKVVRVIKN